MTIRARNVTPLLVLGILLVPLAHAEAGLTCSDGLDGDADGLVDLADPDCTSADDGTEWSLSEGDLLVADEDVYRVDPVSGAITILAQDVSASGVASDSGGNVYYASRTARRIVRIDAETGETRAIFEDPVALDTPLMATGPDQILFHRRNGPSGFAVELASVDPDTHFAVGFGETEEGDDLVLDSAGNVVWVGPGVLASLNRLERQSHSLAEVAGLEIGGMDLAPDGHLLFSSPTTQEVYRVPMPFGTAEPPAPVNGAIAPAGASVLAVEADGSWLLAADAPAQAIYRLPGGSGPAVLLASGAPIDSPRQFALVRPPFETSQCANGIDDDHDGQIDAIDPDCSGPSDGTEWHLEPGDPLAIHNGIVARIDPATGASTTLMAHRQARSAAVGPDAALYVHEVHAPARVTRVALANGAVSHPVTTLEAGPVAVGGAGILYYGAGSAPSARLLAVDLAAGIETLLATGGELDNVSDVVVEASGDPVVSARGRLVRVDGSSGSQTLVWNFGGLTTVRGIAVDPSGDLVATTSALFAPARFRLLPGGAGPPVDLASLGGGFFGSVVLEADGSALVAMPDGVHRFPGGVGPSVLVAATSETVVLEPVDAPRGVAACANGLDDDGDGRVDGADPDCIGPSDNAEAPVACGLGTEIAWLLPLVRLLRRRRASA